MWERANAFEREFLFQQLTVLKDVDETPRSKDYWRSFVERLIVESEGLGLLGREAKDSGMTDLDRPKVVALIAASYVPAVQFLVTECGMSEEEVDALPTAQAVFLAMVRFHRLAVDEYFKWTHVPLWQAEQNESYQDLDRWLNQKLEQVGWIGVPTGLFLPAVRAARTAQFRCQQMLALVQTVEALRMYAAENEGNLPRTLDRIRVPLPLDPFTGAPLHYELKGKTAILTTVTAGNLRHRLILSLAR